MDTESILEKNYRSFLRRGNFVADVGAHTGRHTKCLIKKCGWFGRVAAFEPLPQCFLTLRDNLGTKRNTYLFNAAVGARPGKSTFTVQVGAEQESGLRRRLGPKATRCEEIFVEVVTLDETLKDWRRLDFIKIDTEGGELDVLAGGERVITRHRPIISFEAGVDAYEHYGKTTQDFLDYAETHEMLIFDMFGREMTSALWKAERANQTMCDFFYIPREKTAWLLRKTKA